MSGESFDYMADASIAIELLSKDKKVAEALDLLRRGAISEAIVRLRKLGFNRDQIAYIISTVRKLSIDKALKLYTETIRKTELHRIIKYMLIDLPTPQIPDLGREPMVRYRIEKLEHQKASTPYWVSVII